MVFFNYYFVIYILSMPGIKLLPKPVDQLRAQVSQSSDPGL